MLIDSSGTKNFLWFDISLMKTNDVSDTSMIVFQLFVSCLAQAGTMLALPTTPFSRKQTRHLSWMMRIWTTMETLWCKSLNHHDRRGWGATKASIWQPGRLNFNNSVTRLDEKSHLYSNIATYIENILCLVICESFECLDLVKAFRFFYTNFTII